MHTTDAYLQHHVDRTAQLQRSARPRRRVAEEATGHGAAATLRRLVTARPRAPLPAPGGRAPADEATVATPSIPVAAPLDLTVPELDRLDLREPAGACR